MIQSDCQSTFFGVVINSIMLGIIVIHDGVEHRKIKEVVVELGLLIGAVIFPGPLAVGFIVKTRLSPPAGIADTGI